MQDWWKGAVIYQIYPRSFQDDSGDGIGDLAGITRRLDYVASLGVDAIWISPFFPSPQRDMGYDVSDYTGIDPLFGSLEAFDALMARAHELGLKVIIDLVISHSSDLHPWFMQSRAARSGPKADWYVWADPQPDGSPPNNWLSVFGGSAWEWDTRRRQYYFHNFLPSQPDLNFHNPEVQEALLDVMRFWCERGVDGFRLDTVNYYFHDAKLRSNPVMPRPSNLPEINPYDMQQALYSKSRPENLAFLARLREVTDSYSGRTLVGEVGDSGLRQVELMAEYTSGPKLLHMAYSFAMLGPEFTAAHFRSTIQGFFDVAPFGWPCWSFSNHDVPRHISRWSSSGRDPVQIARLAAAMIGSFQGSICLYQGEELGQLETEILHDELTDPRGIRFWPEDPGRDGCRTPMVWDDSPQGGFSGVKPWLPVKPPQLARNVAAQERDPAAPLHFYRAMLGYRRHTPELISGETEWIDLPEPILGFHRLGPTRRVTCLFNVGTEPVQLRLSGQAEIIGPGSANLVGDVLTLPGLGMGWLSAERPPFLTLLGQAPAH